MTFLAPGPTLSSLAIATLAGAALGVLLSPHDYSGKAIGANALVGAMFGFLADFSLILLATAVVQAGPK